MTRDVPRNSDISGHTVLGAEIDGAFVFHLGDALSTVRDVVDDTGAVIKSFEFDEYGNLLDSSGTGTTSPKTWIGGLSVNDDRADSGMFNMGHRNYAAGVLGRFISRDPIGHRGGLNLYAYPTSPVNRVDPTGLFIKATLDLKSGTLTVQDYAPSENSQGWKLQCTKTYSVFSGDKKAVNDPSQGHVPFIGPVPVGKYYLGDPVDVSSTHQDLVSGSLNWVPILAQGTFLNVHHVRDPNGKMVKRDEFYVHPGLVSQGCVTFKSDIPRGQEGYPGSSDYNEFLKMLQNTSPLTINKVKSGLVFSSTTPIKVPGILVVR